MGTLALNIVKRMRFCNFSCRTQRNESRHWRWTDRNEIRNEGCRHLKIEQSVKTKVSNARAKDSTPKSAPNGKVHLWACVEKRSSMHREGRTKEHIPPRWAHLISRSACILLAHVHLPDAHNPEERLGVRVKKHAPRCREAHIKERAPSRRVHPILRSACTSLIRARLPNACNPEAQLRTCAEEHAYERRRARIEKHTPFRQQYPMSKRSSSTSTHHARVRNPETHLEARRWTHA